MIRTTVPYSRLDSLREVIEEDNRMISLLNRFGIALGFGDASIEAVCRKNGVDTDTFLAVANFKAGKDYSCFSVSLQSLMGYLRSSHVRFLDFTLPYIKRILLDGIHDASSSDVAMVILKFYDEYVAEVREHMDYEDSVVFSYVENLLEGNVDDRSEISDFSNRHDHMAGKLDDLKELFIYKFVQPNNESISDALLQLMECGKELKEHCEIENRLLFPEIQRLERRLMNQKSQPPVRIVEEDNSDILTDREKEVLREITYGLSTKEIADKMCLSFHTVTTYRKNIGEKLNIHSAAGMAVYAILHHIVDLRDLSSDAL